MGKVRRYKKKLAKVAAGTNDTAGQEEQPQQTDYLELAEELLSLKKDDDKMSVCSVMKSIKSSGGGESIKLKKNAKRCLKHAFLLKRLENTPKKKGKMKRKSQNDDADNDDDKNNIEVNISNQKVLNWSVGNTIGNKHATPAKKHTKGFKKKHNAQLAKDLVLFSNEIKKQIQNRA